MIEEAPLEILHGGKSQLVVMRTPGHDLELCRGLLLAEGLNRMGEPLPRLVQEGPNQVSVELGAELWAQRWADRKTLSSSACGVCGAASLSVLEELATPLSADVQMKREDLLALPEALRSAQSLFDQTGAVHAAGLWQGGRMELIREDVGRHNAVDKLVGRSHEDGRLPLSEAALVVSGRVSYEIVHKAVAAGIPFLVAVSAPSSLAVDLAERWRLTLLGFVRDGRANVYSHAHRIL